MNRLTPLPRAGLLCAAIALSIPAVYWPRTTAAQQDGPRDVYRILVERNMFLRDRGHTPPSGLASSRPARDDPGDADTGIVLTGVAGRSGRYVAFLEDRRTNTTLRVRVGDAIGLGRIGTITLDGAEYERDGRTTRVRIGRNLAGAIAAVTSDGPSETAGGSATRPAQPTTRAGDARRSPSADTTKDSDAAGILERMRRRRERELSE